MSYKFIIYLKSNKVSSLEIKKNSIAIIGWHDGGAGRIESWFEKTHNYHVACFINPSDTPLNINSKLIKRGSKEFSYPVKNKFKKKPLINKKKWAEYLIKVGINKALITTDDSLQRYKEIKYAKKMKIKLVNAIHPSVNIMPGAKVKDNVILHEGSYIGYKVELKDGVIIDGAYLGHHTIIKECSTLLAGSVTGGNVVIGKFTKVYLGAIISNKIEIGKNCIIGAGSLILKNIKSKKLVAQKTSNIIIENNV